MATSNCSASENTHATAAPSESALIFMGTGCSSMVPNVMCLIRPSDPPCSVCVQSLSIPPERNPNYSIAEKFPYLIPKKPKEGQEIRRVAQLAWNIIADDINKPFYVSGLKFTPLPTLETVKRLCPKQTLLIGMTHEFDHHKDNEFLKDWSRREGIPVQLAHDGLKVPINL